MVVAGFDLTSLPQAHSVPFYDTKTSLQLGVFSEFSTPLPISGDCVTAGTFSFDWNGAAYASQINTASSCNSEGNSIVGGSGAYACVTGQETNFGGGGGVIESKLTICNSGCPF